MPAGAVVCRFCSFTAAELDGAFDPALVFGKVRPNVELMRSRARDIVAKLRIELGEDIPIGKDESGPVRARVREAVESDESRMTLLERGMALQSILDELLGFGPLGPLLRDPRTQNIFCVGTNPIVIEHGGQLRKTVLAYEDETHFRRTVDRFLAGWGLRIGEESPMAEQIGTSSLVRVLIPPRVKQATLTTRQFPEVGRFWG